MPRCRTMLLMLLPLVHSWAPAVRPLMRRSQPRALAIALDASGWSRGEDAGDAIDVARVEELISERVGHKRKKSYDQADAIRDELSTMGVTLWDRERVWVVGDAPPPRRRESDGSGGLGNNFYRDTQRRAQRIERVSDYAGGRYDYQGTEAEHRPRTSERVLNEWGHDYSRATDDDMTKLDGGGLLRVNEILRDRLRAKFDKKFDKADQLLEELQQLHGVNVNDGMKVWRADGKPFVRNNYKRVGALDARVDAARIDAIIRERLEARRARDYRAADAFLAELLNEHGVVLNDAEYSWRYVGSKHDGRYGEGGGYGRRRSTQRARKGEHDYQRERDDVELSTTEQAEISALLAKRMASKMRRDFETADQLQTELRADHGVEVDDKRRTWRVAYPLYDDDDE